MNKKTSLAEKLRDFVVGKGFYVVVLVCVAAVGISGWYLVQSISSDEDLPVTPVTGNVQMEVSLSTPVPSQSVPSQAEISAQVTPPPVIETESPAPVTEPEPSAPTVEEPASIQAPLVYTWPVKGEVLAEYSLEVLAYDETMGDWRIHSGLDIAADQGANVLATAAGTVIAVEQDDLMGTTVVIDHGQGLTSSYSNLQAVPTVEIGDSVYTGSIIGAVGSTAIAESMRASHLHFEIAKDGVAIDPMEYLPQL